MRKLTVIKCNGSSFESTYADRGGGSLETGSLYTRGKGVVIFGEFVLMYFVNYHLPLPINSSISLLTRLGPRPPLDQPTMSNEDVPAIL